MILEIVIFPMKNGDLPIEIVISSAVELELEDGDSLT